MLVVVMVVIFAFVGALPHPQLPFCLQILPYLRFFSVFFVFLSVVAFWPLASFGFWFTVKHKLNFIFICCAW